MQPINHRNFVYAASPKHLEYRDSMRFFPKVLVSVGALLVLVGLVACGEEDETPTGPIELSITPALASGDVGTSISFALSAKRSDGSSAPSGTIINVVEQACIGNQDSLGRFGNQGNSGNCAQTIVQLVGDTGVASVDFNCDMAGETMVLAFINGQEDLVKAAGLTCNAVEEEEE